MGIHLPILRRLRSGGSAFSPISLFAASEPGVWYDPSDLTTMFQDAAGTTPVTAVEQPVGLRLDKSRGLVLGTELVTNPGPFTATTGWTGLAASLAVSSSKLRVTASGSPAPRAISLVSTAIGATYKVTAVFENISGSNGTLYSVRASNNSDGSSGFGGVTNVSGGTHTFYVTASATTTYVYVRSDSTDQVFDITSFSVRELPGSHAFQTTDINRPVLSARYNLLTQTEDFSQSVWSKSNCTASAHNVSDPIGGNTASTITATNANAFFFYNTTSNPTNTTATATVWARRRTGTGDVTLRNHAQNNTATTLALTSSWQLFTISVTAVGATQNCWVLNIATSGDAVDIWHPDLRVSNDGVGLPAYQRVTTATDYDTTGFPLYLRYNGTNSTMQTPSIDFSSTDKMSVFSGLRKLSDTAGAFVELSANTNTNAGAFWLFAPGSSGGVVAFDWFTRGSAGVGGGQFVTPSNAAYPAPGSYVVTGTGNIAGDAKELRVNGASAGTNSADQGTGNFGNYPLYLGARGGSSLWFNGRDYGLVVLGRTPTAAEITSMETWMNGKTAAYGPPVDIEILTRDGSTILTRAGDTIIARAN